MIHDVRTNPNYAYYLCLDGNEPLEGVIWADTDTNLYGTFCLEDGGAPMLVNGRPHVMAQRGTKLRMVYVPPHYWTHPYRH